MMNDLLVAALALAVCYLIGGIPFALVVGRLFFGMDVREHGSGNLGATNAFRVLGPWAGAFVLFLDVAKGAVAVSVARVLTAVSGTSDVLAPSWFLLLATFAVVAGHIFSPYLRFRGGKGVAAAAGALVVIMPLTILLLTAVFVLVVALSRWVSLGSIVVAVMFPFAAYAMYSQDPAAVVLTVIASGLVLWRHRENMSRIIKGTEARLGEPSGPEAG